MGITLGSINLICLKGMVPLKGLKHFPGKPKTEQNWADRHLRRTPATREAGDQSQHLVIHQGS